MVAMARPATVDHTAHVTIQLDVVQVVLSGLQLKFIFLALIAQRSQLRMTVQRVFIEVDFGIQGYYIAGGSLYEGIDFENAGIGGVKGFVQGDNQLDRLFERVAFQSQREGESTRLARVNGVTGYYPLP